MSSADVDKKTGCGGENIAVRLVDQEQGPGFSGTTLFQSRYQGQNRLARNLTLFALRSGRDASRCGVMITSGRAETAVALDPSGQTALSGKQSSTPAVLAPRGCNRRETGKTLCQPTRGSAQVPNPVLKIRQTARNPRRVGEGCLIGGFPLLSLKIPLKPRNVPRKVIPPIVPITSRRQNPNHSSLWATFVP